MTQDLVRDSAIRTPDQRLRVFVSSTLTELADERVEVARAISALRLTPVLFEQGARAHPPQELYRAYLEQSDIFIGLYWQRYGWVGPGMEISGLEDEFQLSQLMPRLLYIKSPAPDRDAQLTAMLERIRADPTDSYRAFRTPRELGRLVRDDLAMLLSERFIGRSDGASPAGSRDLADRPRRPPSVRFTSTALIGRDHDVALLVDLLATDEARLVTLTGPGGIGKTRLAQAVADSVMRAGNCSVVFVPLAAIALPELVLPQIAAALGAQIDGGDSLVEILAEHFSATPTLLVLDNLEQVVGVAPELDELLARCHRLKILATSRTVLRLRSEHEYAVAPLEIPASSQTTSIEDLALNPAVALFIDRTRAVRHDFALNADNAVAIAEICRRLEGLPLAIELAAARVRSLDPSALLARLGNRLDTLDVGPVDLPERQRTLRATIDWSFGLLDGRERDMLTALAVFVDGWTLEAAVQVSGVAEDPTLDLIDALIGHSLVQATARNGQPRFRMLETVREFCAERLTTSPLADEIQQRHAGYFRRLVEASHWPSPGEAAWAENLLAEEGNLRLAIGWFIEHDITPLPHMFLTLWRFWQLRDRMAEGRGWISELLLQAGTLDDASQAELWLTWAMIAAEVGDDDSALKAADELNRLQARTDDAYLHSVARMARSWILPIVDDFEGALQAATQALEGFRDQGQKFMAANATFTLGMLEMAIGRHPEAQEHLAEVRSLGEDQFGNNWLTSVACVRLAALAVDSGRIDEARALLLESLEVNEDTERSTLVVTFCLVAYAQLALAEGDPSRAALALGATNALRSRAGLVAWPLARAGERKLLAEVQEVLPADEFKEAFERGTHLNRREAIDLVKGEDTPPGARRVVKTFMFTDVVRSTNLVDALGDEAWAMLLAWHDATLRELFAAHGGKEVQATGDGFFVYFNNPEAAIRCAIDVQRTLDRHRKDHGFAPQVRIGVHATPADQTQSNFQGKGVHQAARIAALAEGGEIVASSETARDRADISHPRTVTLKGIVAPIDVVSIVWR